MVAVVHGDSGGFPWRANARVEERRVHQRLPGSGCWRCHVISKTQEMRRVAADAETGTRGRAGRKRRLRDHPGIRRRIREKRCLNRRHRDDVIPLGKAATW